jgi:hypothetical protein
MPELHPELKARLVADKAKAKNGTQPEQPDTDTWGGWRPLSLGPALRGDQVEPAPTMLERDDGKPLLYRGKNHVLFAEPEAGKSTLAAELAKREIEAGNRVLIVDFETGPVEIGTKLRDLGADPDAADAGTVYVQPDSALTDQVWDRLSAKLAGVSLAWIDGVTEALSLHSLTMSNEDIATWQAILPKRLKRLGIATLEIDHVTKAADGQKRFAIGGQHKKAGIDVALNLKAIKPFGRGMGGSSQLLLEKDRPGHLRPLAGASKHLATVSFDASDDGSLRVTLEAPNGSPGPFRPTFLMEQVSRAVEAHPRATKNTIRQLVNGKNDAKDLALTLLVDEGHVTVEREGQAHRHTSVKPFREVPDA